MRNYTEFLEELKLQVMVRAGEDKEVVINKVDKINLGSMDTLTIIQKNENDVSDISIAPNFYVEFLFEEYKAGKSIIEIAEYIICSYMECIRSVEKERIDMMLSYEQCREKICYKVINTEKNMNILEETVSFPELDLSIMLYILIKDDENGISLVRLKHEYLTDWGITPEYAMKLAMRNTIRLFPAEILTMREIIDDSAEKIEGFEEPFYIMTNKKKLNGFSVILYPHVLKEFAEKMNNSLYILPSSIHECILVPALQSVDYFDLFEIVKEVNATVLAPEDFVSDSVYYYDREKDRLDIMVKERNGVNV